MHELVLKNVDKVYPGGIQAVFDFNIEVEHGEFIVMVGPSGCGKSTVLRMIAGLEEITAGDMHLKGERINNVAPSDRDISMVFQNYALYGHMSVYQNMGFSQTIRHEAIDILHKKVMEASNVVQLDQQLNRYPKNLSGGQRQRVALGRSIVSSANVILMDEPLSNLDAKLRVESRRALTKLHKQLDNTFVYVTHDQTEALTMATRIVVMDAGRVQQIGTPFEVYHWPENMFVGGFIGSPPMNFLHGRVENKRFIATGINLAIPQKLLTAIDAFAGDEIVLGIRPEHFSPNQGIEHERVSVAITSSEYLGNHALVYLNVGETNCIANMRLDGSVLDLDATELFIDMSSAHFFDPQTTMRIRAQENE
ncbi:MAG: ABC transporter ATP-binding protein [Candidatus Promineifilaceae bacterium]